MECYWGSDLCYVKDCSGNCHLKKGDLVSLSKFQRKNSKLGPKKVKGVVLYLSKSHMPYKGACKDHASGLTVWLENSTGLHRCIV